MTTREQIEQEIKQRQEWLKILADFEAGHEMQMLQIGGKWEPWGNQIPPNKPCLETCQFRRKPKPRVLWVNEYDCTGLGFSSCYSSLRDAENNSVDSGFIRTVKFVEVIE